uniref:Mitochondrial inner membrane protease subunit 2 n=1 Tax=Equus asinus TaxID=9793 RepID=A0A9L0IVQ2_EQUAS
MLQCGQRDSGPQRHIGDRLEYCQEILCSLLSAFLGVLSLFSLTCRPAFCTCPAAWPPRALKPFTSQFCYWSPKNPEQKIIKRVIALEGDIVKTIGHKNRYVKVPRGHIWVEGDHHGHSFDSNSFGPVSLGLLHAHATHILWPPERWQKLESVLPPERLPVQSEKESLHGSP